MRFINIIGNKYNRLTVLSLYKKIKPGRFLWECKCECGKTKIARSSDLKRGKTKSCGCALGEANIVHGEGKTRFYRIFASIKDRCNNKNLKSYNNYGGRGIICEWNNYLDFKKDMYAGYIAHIEKFGRDNTSIDRVDNDGNYCKENCRWATNREQASNKRNTKKTWLNGAEYTVVELSRMYNIGYTTLLYRLFRKKMPAEFAIKK